MFEGLQSAPCKRPRQFADGCRPWLCTSAGGMATLGPNRASLISVLFPAIRREVGSIDPTCPQMIPPACEASGFRTRAVSEPTFVLSGNVSGAESPRRVTSLQQTRPAPDTLEAGGVGHHRRSRRGNRDRTPRGD